MEKKNGRKQCLILSEKKSSTVVEKLLSSVMPTLKLGKVILCYPPEKNFGLTWRSKEGRIRLKGF